MFLYGLIESLGTAPFIALAALALLIDFWRLRGTGHALALRTFRVTREEDGDRILITGRPSGLAGWILSSLRIDADTTFRVNTRDLTIDEVGAFGFRTRFLPLAEVVHVRTGFHRSILLLALCITLLVFSALSFLVAWAASSSEPFARQSLMRSAWVSLLLGMIAAAILYWFYQLSKQVYVVLESAGGALAGVSFKRSVIEGVTVEYSQALDVAEVLNNLVLRAGKR